MQKSPGIHLEIALPRTTLGSSVLKQFCKEYSLSEQDCMLSCNGQSVNSSKRLHEVCQNQISPLFVLVVTTSSAPASFHRYLQMVCSLQFPGSSTGNLCLEATLRPSAALHVWQAYHHANLADASLENMADDWEGATAQFVGDKQGSPHFCRQQLQYRQPTH